MKQRKRALESLLKDKKSRSSKQLPVAGLWRIANYDAGDPGVEVDLLLGTEDEVRRLAMEVYGIPERGHFNIRWVVQPAQVSIEVVDVANMLRRLNIHPDQEEQLVMQQAERYRLLAKRHRRISG